MCLGVESLIRAYAISDNAFLPVAYTPNKKTIYITNELYIALYRATISKLKEADAAFTADVGTSEYQLVCLVGDNASQSVSNFELRDIVIEVPVSKVYKID